jgi:glutamate-1-semialdehyde 2,1-aminomutase
MSLYNEALKYIPGGVNSPVRAFKSVGMNPVFIKKGEGSKIFDEDGNEYIDYVGSWGPLILGHRHPHVTEALERCLKYIGTSFGAPTELETILASMVIEAVPSVEMLRLVNSGTEATMSALRLARGYTGRKKIVKFEGCYHGHADFLLIKAGSGALTLGVPTSLGVPEETAVNTIVADFNNTEKLKEIFRTSGEDIAAVIVEPVAGNMGVVPPAPGFLERVVELANEALAGRGLGEEVFLDPIRQRLERHQNPAQRARRVFNSDGMYGLIAHTAIRPGVTKRAAT